MELTKKHCVPCEAGVPPMSDSEEDKYLKKVPSWSIIRGEPHKLRREFVLKDFKEAINFINKIAEIAEQEQHHPDIYIFYNKVKIELLTHAIKGLSENDFILAAKIDKLT